MSGGSRAEAARWLRLAHDLGMDGIAARPAAPRAVSGPPPAGAALTGAPGPQPAAEPPVAPARRLGPPEIGATLDDAPAIAEALAEEDRARAMKRLEKDVLGACTRCRLCEGRQNVVFGVGDPQARLMFVGEGPGADEDVQGEPFVGRAGQLLDRIIAAMGLSRPGVYIANVVKCRPPENRNPRPDEAATCLPFLRAQIAIIRPEVIVTLGKVALEELMGEKIPSITRVRGEWLSFHGIPVKATFHPAYLLRSPSAKRPVWDDMQDVMSRLGLEPPGTSG